MIQTEVIPDEYRGLTPEEIDARIAKVKGDLGKKLSILGHYYQRDDVVKWSDHQGDSFNTDSSSARSGAQSASSER